ncbi:GDP-fucose protein [Carex littledalei]|uniref:GDP-fucose protein O-fucosyltransferase 2 n=1 Tax=Carex littledalei TaxID=544730 RepID=A0A833QSX6_9POAL|nr:GDP-fucose protein [Carex littledalei]
MARDPPSPSHLSTSSDDEEDPHQTLIVQNETKPPPPFNPSTGPSVFEIGRATVSRISRSVAFPSKRCLILAVCLPLVLILLFFSLDFRRAFSSVIPAGPVATSDRMREAELRALFLLRNQQLALTRLWNSTLLPDAGLGSQINGSDLSPTPSPIQRANLSDVSLAEIKSALLDQMRVNREIHDVLLSAHGIGNFSELANNFGPEFDFPDYGTEICKKTEKQTDRRTIEWKPKKDRFLFAICLSGQMSNHLICLEKHMFFAALLDRILILPSSKVDYEYSHVLDIEHINKCLGRKVVMTFEEYEQERKGKIHINKFICYMASPPCFLDEEHVKRLKNAGVSIGSKIEAVWPEDAKLKEPKKRFVGDIMPKFSSNEEVIAVGDLFYADVEEEWVMQPGGPLKHSCQTVIRPSRLIVLTAQRFIQTFLGGNFVALHFRRHGFLKFCNVKKESCFFPIPQAAQCVKRVVEEAGSPVIYLSTDAADSETSLLQKLVKLNGEEVPLIRRPEHNSAEKWDALMYRNHMGGDAQVEAMLDKTICALAKVFVGSAGSTFTEDILRLRRGWGSASTCDQYICQGHVPDFIAETD